MSAAASSFSFRRGRRRLLLGSLAAPLAGALPGAAHAGAQRYEPLADAVRVALAARIADARPPARNFNDPTAQVAFIEWMGEMSGRLTKRKPDDRLRLDFLRTLDYEATRAGLDSQLVLALIEVESNFRKYAISSAGARGYMQVMPFWTRLIGDGDTSKLFDLGTNLRYGCVILRHYLDMEQGNLYYALGRYNGSRGQPQYPNAVNAVWQKRWAFAPRLATLSRSG
jgi:soluble lytic murein transglycosylase-like protein